MTRVPLSILDLAPISSGGTVAGALRNTIELAKRADDLGYHRYWLAEHHLAPGVASSATAVLVGLVAAATNRIRVGSGAVQLGHQTALAVVEQFGTIEALHPGRIDLGLGRSAQRRTELAARANSSADDRRPRVARTIDGLLIPPPVSLAGLARSPLLALTADLLSQPGAQTPEFADQVDDIAALIAGDYRSADGVEGHAMPGEGADLQLWILGSSGGASAQAAGERGLPFAANYHVSPANVLDAVDAYRAAFKPSKVLEAPHVMVSADVVLASDEATARELASPYGLWVRGIRSGIGAVRFPSPTVAAASEWSEQDRALVADRIDTQFVGVPAVVADKLRTLREATRADELLVTTITHDHGDRVRSFELLAAEWRLG